MHTAFGECSVITNVNNIANVNPFRYRGYFYERNSGLYYLKTRFYNPVIGRFISPDDTKYLQPETINGLNLFAYCGNNPVMNIDPNGKYVVSQIAYFKGYSKKYSLWRSKKYKVKRTFNTGQSFKSILENELYFGELMLSNSSISLVTTELSFLQGSSKGMSLIESNVSLVEATYTSIYTGIDWGIGIGKITVGAGFNSENIGIEAMVSALDISASSDYVEATVHMGSIGGELSFDDGTLNLGLSFGIGFSLSINFW